jgi:hypothetical protein
MRTPKKSTNSRCSKIDKTYATERRRRIDERFAPYARSTSS